jgi:RNA polymerase sigma-70 factor, ECF subfamily
VSVLLTTAYRDSYTRLRAAASRLVHRQDADDMVQDAFVRALQREAGFRHDASPATWIHRIVVNACLDERRKRRRRHSLEREAASDVRLFEPPRSPTCLSVRAALRRLSPADRRICLLYDVMGYTHVEIARALRIPIGTSKSRLALARRRLGRMLDPTRRGHD